MVQNGVNDQHVRELQCEGRVGYGRTEAADQVRGSLACSVQRSHPICKRPYSIYLVRRRSNLDGCAAVDVDDLAGDES